MSSFIWSEHALQRWRERFPGIKKDLELGGAKKIGKKTRKLIKQLTPVNAERYMKQGYQGRYYLLGPSQIVFVIQISRVITVFHLKGSLDEDV